MVLYMIFSLCMFWVNDNFILLILTTFFNGIGCTLAIGPSFTICSDTMDEVESLTGKRPQGIMMSVMMCTMKLGIAGGGIIFSLVLDAGGYVADAVQSASAINAILWNMFWLPILIYIVCFALTFFFKTNKK